MGREAGDADNPHFLRKKKIKENKGKKMNSPGKQRGRRRRPRIPRVIDLQAEGWFFGKDSSIKAKEPELSISKYERQTRHSFLSLHLRGEGRPGSSDGGEVSLLSSMGFAARRWGKVARRPKYALINTKETENGERLSTNEL